MGEDPRKSEVKSEVKEEDVNVLKEITKALTDLTKEVKALKDSFDMWKRQGRF